MEREREIARRFSTYQADCEIERGQRIAERDALHLQIEELQEQRENLTHEVNTAHHWLQNYYDNMDEARDRICNDPFSRLEQQTSILEKLAEATDPTTDRRRVSFQNT